MAKQVKTDEEIDEKSIIASFLQDEPDNHEGLISSGDVEKEPVRDDKDNKKRRTKHPDYESLFIKESTVTARTGKMIYIRKDYHDLIAQITQVIGERDISLSGYVDNVLRHHFDTYGSEITELYNEKHKGIVIK